MRASLEKKAGLRQKRLALLKKLGYELPPLLGGVAQLGERCVRNAEVVGSNPIFSKPFFITVLPGVI